MEAATEAVDIAARREWFFREVRRRTPLWFNEDGSGTCPQFNHPWREPLWILPALYTGDSGDVALANRIVDRYDRASGRSGGFKIFQSTVLAGCLAAYGERLAPEARAVMVRTTRAAFDPVHGAARSDYKFHGCNDNMPAMAAKALILGGEVLGDARAVRHGVWRLHEFRKLLTRSAWASEFNSSTYSPITLANFAQIATHARDPETRALARACEHRLWAELLLHYHPGTRHAAGPQCRAYAVDASGCNHSAQMLFWLAFGAEATGRDPVRGLLGDPPDEVVHFQGNPWQNMAEYCELVAPVFAVPPELARLAVERRYPARLRGRGESMMQYDGMAGEYHTATYMEETFSLGTVDTPLCGGEQTMQCYATYRLRDEVRSFRDAATLFCRYRADAEPPGVMERSVDRNYQGERFQASRGWMYTLQKDNVALVLTAPAAGLAPVETATLALSVVFATHRGGVRRLIMGDRDAVPAAPMESEQVVPVSLEAGEVYIHVQPLLLGALPRASAVAFRRHGNYETLDLVNYDGPSRRFQREDLVHAQNGLVLTLDDRRRWPSLEAFHAAGSDARILDYFVAGHRFLRYARRDVDFEVTYTPYPFGVQTRAIDGRTVALPVFESDQVDVSRLPFMGASTDGVFSGPEFPWDHSLENGYHAGMPWIIGSRGRDGETPYRDMASSGKPLRADQTPMAVVAMAGCVAGETVGPDG